MGAGSRLSDLRVTHEPEDPSNTRTNLQKRGCIIEAFLAAHPTLVPRIEAAQQALRPYFPDSQLVLEMFEDPEFGDPPKLHLIVVPTTDPAEAVARYRQFLRAWGNTATPGTHDQFAIILEYR